MSLIPWGRSAREREDRLRKLNGAILADNERLLARYDEMRSAAENHGIEIVAARSLVEDLSARLTVAEQERDKTKERLRALEDVARMSYRQLSRAVGLDFK